MAAKTHIHTHTTDAGHTVHVKLIINLFCVCFCRLSMTAAAGVLTGLAKLKRQDSARSHTNRAIPPTSPGQGNLAPESAPR